MKRKIIHDAINNQEDEDSSAYPMYLLYNENYDKKKKQPVKNIVRLFSDNGSKNGVEMEFKRKLGTG